MENTIFFGNGLNRLLADNISWDTLLNKIKDANQFEDKGLPNTMIFERIILQKPKIHEDILLDEYEVKKNIAGLLKDIQPNKIYRDIYNLNVQHYITTNYDYGFIDSILELSEINQPIQESGTENVYSIRRLKKISNKKEKKKNFWQIHGEIRKPATIMLGLDHYCGYIEKISGYINGKYRYIIDKEEHTELSIEDKFNQDKFNHSSWIELFFTTNVNMIGFSLDFSEIDIWWIINKRARMKNSLSLKNKISNEINFYCEKIDQPKKELLESFDVKVHVIELKKIPDSYTEYFNRVIRQIKKGTS